MASYETAPPASTKQVVSRAYELIGTPYKWGGTSTKGFDCSGLLVYLYKTEVGLEIPRTTRAMLRDLSARVAVRDLKKGDAVLFSRNGTGAVGHVGLYVGDGRFIHAPRKGKSVKVSRLDNPYWKRHLVAVRRWSQEWYEDISPTS